MIKHKCTQQGGLMETALQPIAAMAQQTASPSFTVKHSAAVVYKE
jgi:hypothetical protein